METNSKKKQEKEWEIVPLKPVWQPYNEETQRFLEWFCTHFCNVPSGPKESAKYLTVVSSFLALSQQVFNKTYSQMAIPHDNNYWSAFPYAGRTVVDKVREDLLSSDAITFVEGTGYKNVWKDDHGKWEQDGQVSLYALNDSLLSQEGFVDAEWIETGRPPLQIGQSESRRQRSERKRQNKASPKMLLKDMKKFGKAYGLASNGVTRLNTFMKQHPLALPPLVNGVVSYAACMTRIYHNGSMIEGGRYYGAWTNLKGDYRLQSTIDGEPIVSIDLNASQPTLFNALMGVKMNLGDSWYDLYAAAVSDLAQSVDDYDPLRNKIKQVAVEIIGTGNPKKSKPAKAGKCVFDEETDEYNEIRKKLLDVAPALKSLNDEYLNGAGFISYHEAEMMTLVLHNLMALNIPAYPVHDCLIVKASHQEKAMTVLRDTIQAYIIDHCKQNKRPNIISLVVPVSVEGNGKNKTRIKGYYK
jgi:hypothetical protein